MLYLFEFAKNLGDGSRVLRGGSEGTNTACSYYWTLCLILDDFSSTLKHWVLSELFSIFIIAVIPVSWKGDDFASTVIFYSTDSAKVCSYFECLMNC